MRTATLATTLMLLAACAPKKEAPAPAAPPPPPPAPTVADFAGTWNAETIMPGAKAPVKTSLVINADGTGQMHAEGRDPVPLTLSMSGDSLIAVSAEYESLLRKGVKVTIRTANVKSGTGLSGVVVATYKGKKGDEVANGTMSATKAP
jgi:hypothetical protein